MTPRPSIRATLLAAVALSAVVLAGCEQIGFGDWRWERDASSGMLRLTRVSPEQRIVQSVSSKNPDERREAVLWLCDAERSSSDAITRLLGMILREDPDPTVRAAAARALGTSVNPASAEPLVLGCNDANGFVRLDSVRAVGGKTGDNPRRALLVRLAGDRDAQVRAAAASGLANFPDRRTLEALIAALRDADFAVVYNAEHALIRMTGQSFEYDRDAWNRWLAGLGPEGDPFARAGQTPPRLQRADRPFSQQFLDSLRRAWFWWQADEKPPD